MVDPTITPEVARDLLETVRSVNAALNRGDTGRARRLCRDALAGLDAVRRAEHGDQRSAPPVCLDADRRAEAR